MQKVLIFIFLITFQISIKAQIWNAPNGIREIPIPTLPDIAIASLDAIGPVIYYNPLGCQQAGQYATAFFMAHEYGHHALGHILQRVFNSNNPYVQEWLNENMENEADAYAVRYWINKGNKLVIQAGANFMWNINNNGDGTHPPSRVRANNYANLYLQITGTPLF